MTAKDHLSSWILVAAMMAAGAAWSINAVPRATMAAAEAQRAREATVIDRYALRRARRGWDIAAALGGLATARLGFERFEDVDPPWMRQPDVAEPAQRASATSLNPMRMCLSDSGRECRAAGRHTPQPLSSHDPPLTM